MPCTRTMHMLRDEQSHGLRRRANLVFWPCIAPYRPYLGTHCSTATASRQCTLSAKTAPTLPSRDCSTSGCGSTPSRRPHMHVAFVCETMYLETALASGSGPQPPAHCDPQPCNPSQPLTQPPKPPAASRCHYPSTPTPTLLPNVLHPKSASYPNPNPFPPSTCARRCRPSPSSVTGAALSSRASTPSA